MSVFESAAAVSVISNDAIRRSGVRSIPEALRLAPGVAVGRIDANKWAVSIRGFNDRFANKLLVLMDGRSVYSPAFSGVYWDAQDYLLEDLERIEVVRGPGGTLWGANAVNGVVNIITRDAADTQGPLVQGGYGTEDQGFGAVRYGFPVGDAGHARIYAKFDNYDAQAANAFAQGHDDWRMFRTGMRSDWQLDGSNQLTVQGDFYYGDLGNLLTQPSYTSPYAVENTRGTLSSGGNALARWTKKFRDEAELGEDTELSLQVYYDRLNQKQRGYFDYSVETIDVDLQHRVKFMRRQEFIYGLGYRVYFDKASEINPDLRFIPNHREYQLFSAFIQDEISLLPSDSTQVLKLIVGSKFEHHDYTGWEIQPGARLLWMPATNVFSAWGSVSRAVRTPSRTERDVNPLTLLNVGTTPGGAPVFLRGFGNPAFDSEDLTAYELGMRWKPIERLGFDWTGFVYDYDKLGTAAAGALFPEDTPGDPHVIQPLFAVNDGYGQEYGMELAANSILYDQDPFRVTLRLGYSYLEQDLEGNTFAGGSNDPKHQVFGIASFTLLKNIDFDLWARWIDELPGSGVDSYFELDTRLAWRPTDIMEVALVGRNLVNDQHAEFPSSGSTFTQMTQPERAVYGQLTFRF